MPERISTKKPREHWLASRLPFYYGWLMVPMAILTAIATSPGQTYGVSIFNPSFRQALLISHSQLTGAYMLGTLLAALPQPLFGKLLDRIGIRTMSVVVVIALGFACVLTSRVNNLIGLFFAFWSLRTFGQGALNLVANNTIAMWFQSRLGFVSGLFTVGQALAIGVVPAAFLSLIQWQGWRGAYVVLGIILWLTLLPLVVLVFKDRPQDVGQMLDGSDVNPDAALDSVRQNEMATPLKSARKTRGYWIMLIIVAVWALIVTGITFNTVPLFAAQGLSETVVAASFTTMAVATMITQLASGLLADRLPLRFLASGSLVFFALAILILMKLGSPWLAHLYAILLGIGQGAFTVVNSTVWARYFGRRFLGEIRGSVWLAMVAGSSVGPFVIGSTYDLLGNYRFSLWIFFSTLILISVIALWATSPETVATSPDH